MALKILGFALVLVLWNVAGFMLLIGSSFLAEAAWGEFILCVMCGIGLWFCGRWAHKKFKLGARVLWWVAVVVLFFAFALYEDEHFIVLATGIAISVFFVIQGVIVHKQNRLVAASSASLTGGSTFVHTPIYSSNPVVAKGQQYIERLPRLMSAINNDRIRGQITQLQTIGTQILDYMEANPDHIYKSELFMEFYLPKAVRLLEEYASLSKEAVKSRNMQDAMHKISAAIARIEQAFEHCLSNLYSDRVLDISSDIETLEQMMILEGLE